MLLPPPSHLFPEYPLADQQFHHAGIELALRRVLESGRFILDAETEAFESEFAAFCGADHVIGTGSGTDAIELILRAMGIGAGHAVAVPTMAPSAVAAAVLRSGAHIVLVDVEAETLTLCPTALKEVMKHQKVSAVLAVHLYGHPVEWDALSAVCAAHGALLLEDAAQAHGALYHGRPVGTLGQACAWSFYPTKSLGALGDAGAVSVADAALAGRIRQMRQYGWQQRHVSELPGINTRLDEMQAAILRAKLPVLTAQVERRRELAQRYAQKLRGVQPLGVRQGCSHAFHQFVVRSERRDELGRHLRHHGVPVAVHYPAALHQQPAFSDSEGSFPVAEHAVRQVLSLPLHPYMNDQAVDAVCGAVESFPS
ncbi:MAG: DegT/DnrJ/EryC1/StrS family aminotransferase [Verrucomicrobiaceae bacterium]|nr:DegT/DnrJ/EryC1/StrS family aminotransferase [Verrucomicrobiaceae bacterium]